MKGLVGANVPILALFAFKKSLNIRGFVSKNIIVASLLTKNRTQLVSTNMQKKTQKKKNKNAYTRNRTTQKTGTLFVIFQHTIYGQKMKEDTGVFASYT